MRETIIAPDEYYHIFNRGNNKQTIFVDDSDRARLLFLILALQSDVKIWNIGDYIKQFTKHFLKIKTQTQHRVLSLGGEIIDDIIKSRYVELTNFALMPNHFHLTVLEREEHGIARYMQRVLNSYTKYFNIKYKKSGHLFQGPYKAVHISNNRQLLYLSAYIHRNPVEIKGWERKSHLYPWSSYQDYVKENRWGDLLKHAVIAEQSDTKGYKKFVETSGAKALKKYLDEEHLTL